jgi:hypothetical protein
LLKRCAIWNVKIICQYNPHLIDQCGVYPKYWYPAVEFGIYKGVFLLPRVMLKLCFSLPFFSFKWVDFFNLTRLSQLCVAVKPETILCAVKMHFPCHFVNSPLFQMQLLRLLFVLAGVHVIKLFFSSPTQNKLECLFPESKIR